MTPAQHTALRIASEDARKAEKTLAAHALYREAEWAKVLGDRLEAVLKGEANEVQG